MAEPWIRVHANLASKPVIWRAVEALNLSSHEAMGLLTQFWGGVSQHARNGAVASVSDAQLEAWAGWTKKRGRFAAFIRAHHLDADGRVNEWDDYAGKLEIQRATERERLANKRRSVGQHSTNKSQMLAPARANETRRNETNREREDPREASPDGTALPIVIAVAANQAITARWGEQLHPYTPAAATELAQTITDAGIEHDIARDSIARQCAGSKLPRPPKSPAYFRAGILADWDETLAKRQLAAAPPLNGNGRHPDPDVAARDAARHAGEIFDRIVGLIRWQQAPGQDGFWIIPFDDLQVLGPGVVPAVRQLAVRFRGLKTGAEKEFFLKRDFALALAEATHAPA